MTTGVISGELEKKEAPPTAKIFDWDSACMEVLEKAKSKNFQGFNHDGLIGAANFFGTHNGTKLNTLGKFKINIFESAKAHPIYQNAIANKESDENIKIAMRSAVVAKMEQWLPTNTPLVTSMAQILFEECYDILYRTKEGFSIFFNSFVKVLT